MTRYLTVSQGMQQVSQKIPHFQMLCRKRSHISKLLCRKRSHIYQLLCGKRSHIFVNVSWFLCSKLCEMVRACKNYAKLCGNCQIMRNYAESGILCEKMRDLTNYAIPHPPHLNGASATKWSLTGYQPASGRLVNNFEVPVSSRLIASIDLPQVITNRSVAGQQPIGGH